MKWLIVLLLLLSGVAQAEPFIVDSPVSTTHVSATSAAIGGITANAVSATSISATNIDVGGLITIKNGPAYGISVTDVPGCGSVRYGYWHDGNNQHWASCYDGIFTSYAGGSFFPGGDNYNSLGASFAQWKDLWVAGTASLRIVSASTVTGTAILNLKASTVTPTISFGAIAVNTSGTICQVSGSSWVKIGTSTACSFVPSRQ